MYASLYLLVAVEAFFFVRWPAALAHLTVALVGAPLAFSVVGVPLANRASLVALPAVIAVTVGWLVRRIGDADTDGLTGLANRRGFDRVLRGQLSAAGRDDRLLAVALLDLDHFTAVNDTGGRSEGDRLLRVTAQTWQAALGPAQVLARSGGGEFALLLPGHTMHSAAGVAEILRDRLPAGRTCSVGIAARAEGDSVSLLVGRADAALNDAKRGGRNRISWGPTSTDDVAAADLARGLRAGELFVVYQPMVDLTSEETVGVEALVRWRHPTRGLVGPDGFIPIVEAGDLIHVIGRFVLAEAVAQGVRWREQHGLLLEIAVNAAGGELTRPGYADDVLQLLTDAGLPANRLTVEVTERTLDADSPQVLKTLQELQAAGVRVSLDDFGTGYSSLSRLDRLPVDVLKIDQSFIRPLRAGSDTAVLAAVVALGTALGLEVVGEGVETAEQAGILYRLGCGQAQGYHFGRPAAVTDDVPARADHPVPGSHRGRRAVGRSPVYLPVMDGRPGNRYDPEQPTTGTADPTRSVKAHRFDPPGGTDATAARRNASGGQLARIAVVEAQLADLECRRYSGSAGITDRAQAILVANPGPAFSAQRSRARLILTDQASRTGDVTQAVTTAQSILLRARARAEFTVAARSEALIAWCLDRTGARGDALTHAVEAVRLLPADAPPHLLVDHRMILALFTALQTPDNSCRPMFDAVLADADQLNNPHLLLSVLNNYAWTLWNHGQATDALPLTRRLESVAAAAGIAMNSTTLDTIASVLLDTGDLERAETVGRVMVDATIPEAEVRAAPEALLTLARIRHRRGDAAEALDLVLRAEQLAADRGLPELTAMATMDKSRLLAEAGDTAGAYAALSISHATWVQVRDRDADARAASLQALFETEQARQRSAIFEDLADRDALTGLWNRRHLDRVLPGMLTDHQITGTPLTIAILDVDHFKQVNDDRNHATGDAVLARIGELLGHLVAEPGFAARLGGEEFLLVLPGVDPTAAYALCDRTRRLIGHQPWNPVTDGLPVTVSIGHATSTPTTTVASLLSAADTALYEAKHAGRNQVQPVTGTSAKESVLR